IDTDDIFSHYVVEKSFDGKEYSDIGIVMTSGTANPSEISHYKFKDLEVKANNGIVYYRLRWEEKNRETYYSPVRIVRISKSSQVNDLVTYPNPVKDQLRMTLPLDWQGKTVEVALYTASGSLVNVQKLNSAGQTEVLEMSKLAKGFYLIRVNCNGQVSQQRVIKD
ncbi:MAG: T9SS type A sorting domain-containing protein, partial [Flavisolibacter sp.]